MLSTCCRVVAAVVVAVVAVVSAVSVVYSNKSNYSNSSNMLLKREAVRKHLINERHIAMATESNASADHPLLLLLLLNTTCYGHKTAVAAAVRATTSSHCVNGTMTEPPSPALSSTLLLL